MPKPELSSSPPSVSSAGAGAMPEVQASTSSDPLWRLGPGEALRLPIGPGARRLEVVSGRLWLTRDGRAGGVVEDCWLRAGEGLDLAQGDVVVIDAHPDVAFRLVVPPVACRASAARAAARGERRFSLGGGLCAAEPA